MIKEGNETVTNCDTFKLEAKDGKMRNTDMLDTKGILRLIESFPSRKAEPFKLLLTNEIYTCWSGMKANEYKEYKGLRKESLRDNMTDIEVALTNIGEIAARDIALNEHPSGLKENLKVAARGGSVAKGARDLYEKETKKSAFLIKMH
jgi:hypothetical protein